MSRERSFWDRVQARVASTPAAPMLIDEHDTVLSFADYRDAAERTAAGLAGQGVGPGSRVAYQLPTRLGTIVLMGALARLGAI